jgi:unsaturated rhamnogalacturonyl hydrolase
MFGMVLTRWGELSGDASALDLLSEQIAIFAPRLQHENGLMQHADGWPGDVDTDIYWNRGNSWVTASLSDYLRVRLLRGESDAVVEKLFRDQVSGALALQDSETGLWWTIMNRPGEIYQETSGPALFAYGMARAYRYGILGERELAAALLAVAGVKQRIQPDAQGRPVVTGISLGTDPTTFEGYAQVEQKDDVHYGVGATILALIETSGLGE